MKDPPEPIDGPGAVPAGGSARYRTLIERLYALSRGGTKFGLGRIAQVLRDLGHPELACPSIHVAGSNGKGSTAAFLATILAMSGRRVGLYTSPHLVSLTERVRFLYRDTSVPISEDALVTAVDAVEETTPMFAGLSFFEVVTAAGFWAMAHAGVDVVVVEAGLGARLDATRLVDAGVAVLTDVSLEHTNVLGDTLAEVAREEAAVVRPGRPLVAADGAPEVMEVIERMAGEAAAPLYLLQRDFGLQAGRSGRFDFHLSGGRHLGQVAVSLGGAHQGRNAALAAQAAVLFDAEVREAVLRQGLGATHWPARLERVERPGRPTVLLDGAQNAHAARALAAALREIVESPPLHFLFGVLRDKDAPAMVEELAPLGASWTVTSPPTARARAPEEVRALLAERTDAPIECADSPAEALVVAESRAHAHGGWVVVCGSLYLVGDARALLGATPP